MNVVRKFLIVDDHGVVRQGLKYTLAEAYPGSVFGEAQNAGEMMKQMRKHEWDAVILDINMPGISGVEALKELRNEYSHVPVLMLSMHSEDQYAVRVLKAGAAGFVMKASAPDELVMAVRKVLGGGKYISPSLAEKLAVHLDTNRDRPPHETLSDREFQVLCMIASGKTPAEMADALSLSPKTISTFRARILTKMNLRNNAELTHYAFENRLVE